MRPQFLNPKSDGAVWTFLLVILIAVIIGPFLTIWSLNVLFPVLAIPYTWQTWVAMAILHLLIKGNVSKS